METADENEDGEDDEEDPIPTLFHQDAWPQQVPLESPTMTSQKGNTYRSYKIINYLYNSKIHILKTSLMQDVRGSPTIIYI